MNWKPLCLILLLAAPAAAAPKPKAPKTVVIQPFNGKDLTGWKTRAQGDNQNHWVVGKATWDAADPKALKCEPGGKALVNVTEFGKGLDVYCDQEFGDCLVEVEVMVPQGSNSGIYLMGEYELQVLDSAGKTEIGMGDMGAIYSAAVASRNACKLPGEWQKFVIDFRAPRFGADGAKTANAVFKKVTLNGQVIHENVEVKASTGGGLTGKERATGPLMFQGNHGPVAYRNIRITPAASSRDGEGWTRP